MNYWPVSKKWTGSQAASVTEFADSAEPEETVQ